MKDPTLLLRVAKAINGPWSVDPKFTAYDTLMRMRDCRWKLLDEQERAVKIAEANAAIRELQNERSSG